MTLDDLAIIAAVIIWFQTLYCKLCWNIKSRISLFVDKDKCVLYILAHMIQNNVFGKKLVLHRVVEKTVAVTLNMLAWVHRDNLSLPEVPIMCVQIADNLPRFPTGMNLNFKTSKLNKILHFSVFKIVYIIFLHKHAQGSTGKWLGVSDTQLQNKSGLKARLTQLSTIMQPRPIINTALGARYNLRRCYNGLFFVGPVSTSMETVCLISSVIHLRIKCWNTTLRIIDCTLQKTYLTRCNLDQIGDISYQLIPQAIKHNIILTACYCMIQVV